MKSNHKQNLILENTNTLYNPMHNQIMTNNMHKRVEHIIVAEDSDFDYEHLQKGLRKAGVYSKLTRVVNGQELLDLFENNEQAESKESDYHPSKALLLLLDLKMPMFDGIEALRCLRENKNSKIKDIPVIVITTSMFVEDYDETHNLGIIDYMIKPMTKIETDAMCSEIKRILADIK